MTPAPVFASRHFAWKLTFETDAADLFRELQGNPTDLVVVDTRPSDDYRRGHIPGALSLPHAAMTEERLAQLDATKRYVTYDSGPSCNAATKGALKLTSAGLRTREMIGGFASWENDGRPTAATQRDGSAAD